MFEYKEHGPNDKVIIPLLPKLVSQLGSAPPYSDTVAFCLVVSVLAAFVAAAVVVVAAEEKPDSLAPAVVAFAIFPLVFVLLAVYVCIPFGKVKQIFLMELVDKTRDTVLLMKP